MKHPAEQEYATCAWEGKLLSGRICALGVLKIFEGYDPNVLLMCKIHVQHDFIESTCIICGDITCHLL